MIEKPFVFVLMPFDKSFNDIYQFGIKETCTSLGCYCERADEQMFEERILDRVYNQINKADIIIADMSDKNPNVFYETGFAHALSKRVILLTKNSADIPFDLLHHHHIVYSGQIVSLREQLSKRLDWFIKNPTGKKLPNANELKYYIKGKDLSSTKEVNYIIGSDPAANRFNDTLTIQIDIFNPNNYLVIVKQKITLVTSNTVILNNSESNIDTIILPDEKLMHVYPKDTFDFFPNMWTTISFPFDINMTEAKEDIILRVYNEVDIKEIPFTVKLLEYKYSG